MKNSFFDRLNFSLHRLPRAESGNVAMMFGLLLMPMLGATGLAIDFGSILTARNKGQVAADAAALQASGVARDIIKSGDGSPTSTAAALAEAKTRAEKLFKVHADQSGLTNYTPTVSVVRSGQKISTTVSYSVQTQTYIAKLFSQSAFTASGSAISSSSLPNYSDVYLALDVSGSMGIAASQAEMVKLFNAKGNRSDGKKQATSCVFGCHTIEGGWNESFSTIATRAGVRMRIDVLRDAIIDMIATAQDDADSAPIYRLALYTMGASLDASTWSLNALAPLTNNFATLLAAARTIDIATPPASAPQKQNSYLNEQITSIASIVSTSYDGSSQSKSKKYLFVITDGVRDVPSNFGSCRTPPTRNYGKWPGNTSSGRCTNAIDPSLCKTMKDRGVTVGVIYTTFVPIAEDANQPYNAASNYDKWFGFEVRDNPVPNGTTLVYDQVPKSLRACASPGWYFEASDEVAIDFAMKTMFDQTTFAPTLTN